MKKLLEHTRKEFFYPDTEEWKVRRVAFWSLIAKKGGTLTVKAAGEELRLKVVRAEDGHPMWYTSDPIAREFAESITGYPLQDAKTYTLVIMDGKAGVNVVKSKDYVIGPFAVPDDKVRIVK